MTTRADRVEGGKVYEYFVTRGGAPDHRGHACDALPDGDGWELIGPAQPMPISKRQETNDYDRATGVELIDCELVWTWRRPKTHPAAPTGD